MTPHSINFIQHSIPSNSNEYFDAHFPTKKNNSDASSDLFDKLYYVANEFGRGLTWGHFKDSDAWSSMVWSKNMGSIACP